MEAMALGVPVVTTPVGAIPELLVAGGVLVPVGDPLALARAVEAIRSPEARAEFSAAAVHTIHTGGWVVEEATEALARCLTT